MPARPRPPARPRRRRSRGRRRRPRARPRRPGGAAAPRPGRPRCGGRHWRAPPGRRGRRPAGGPRRASAKSPSASKVASVAAQAEVLDQSPDRRRQAEVVERGRPQLAGQGEQLAHRLVGERLGLVELRLELGRRRLARRLEPQQHPGQRLVDLVVEVPRDPGALLLLGPQRGGAGAAPLRLQPPHHAQEGELDALDLLRMMRRLEAERRRAGTAASPRRRSAQASLLDANSGAQSLEPAQAAAGFVLSLGFAWDGGLLVTGGTDGTVRLFDTNTLKPVGAELPAPIENQGVFAFVQPSGGVVAVQAAGRILRWDLDPKRWAAQACSVANRQLTDSEWRAFLPDRPYAPSCGP